MGNLAQHAGQRIRTFRKLRGMSAQQLAQRIGKSKATVYKYESGEIPPDVDTLADISRELDVEPAHLLDVPFQKRDVTPKLSFFDANRLYAYYYDGRTRQMTRSLLTFCPSADGEPWEAFLYMNVPDFNHPERARYLYTGTLASYEIASYFTFRNLTLPIETLVIELLHTFRTGLCTWGLFLGLSDQPLTPMATKILLSKMPLSDDELANHPMTFTKSELRDVREKNVLLLSMFQG